MRAPDFPPVILTVNERTALNRNTGRAESDIKMLHSFTYSECSQIEHSEVDVLKETVLSIQKSWW